ncbi:hypothetical protein ROBYS_20010 [Roseobacter sp. OBYS 0001]|nr:hypothetical protein ROBYS_20010 [Roseobacter sp. OBYS 0001]
MLGGDGGTGKSTLALGLAVATVAGVPWVGRSIEDCGPAAYLSAEDDKDELHRRLDAICRAKGVAIDGLHDLSYRSLAGEDALLAVLNRGTNTLTPTPLYAALDQWMATERPSLIVLDTLADLTAGEENNRAHARQFIGMLRHLAITHNTAVMLLAHPSLTGISSGSGLSGSTAWNASVRSRLYLERISEDGYEPDPDARRLSTKKANYARTGDEFLLRWQDGAFMPDAPAGGLDRAAGNATAERVFLNLLREFVQQGRRVNASGGTTYAPKVFAAHPGSEGITKRAMTGAMERLLQAGKVRIETEGPPSRRVSFLEVSL